MHSAEGSSSTIEAVQIRTKSYLPKIEKTRFDNQCVEEVDIPTSILPHEGRYTGKVRDTFICNDFMVLVSTDRQSAFDRPLAKIPFKGAVLNQISAWWFNLLKEEGIAQNHIISVPDSNVTIGKKCKVFPVEFVMRGYLTGSTGTSIWKNYSKGVRNYCGHILPNNLVKNQKLPTGNLLTPTTKDDTHDELTSAEEIISSGRMSQEQWETCESTSHKMFLYGQHKALQQGLILVDTKYEFGVDNEGNILVVDEIHTPDSSRYWLAASYEERMLTGQEPENIDKEFLRLWFVNNCDPYNDKILPDAPAELVNELSRRYILLYEVITGEEFEFPNADISVVERINVAISKFMLTR